MSKRDDQVWLKANVEAKPVAIDQVHLEIPDAPIAAQDGFRSATAWCLLAAVTLDAWGNVLGLPVFTGLVVDYVTENQVMSVKTIARMVTAAHLIMIGVGLLLLRATPWPDLLPAIYAARSRATSPLVWILLLVVLVWAIVVVARIVQLAQPGANALMLLFFLIVLLLYFLTDLSTFLRDLVPRLTTAAAGGLLVAGCAAFYCLVMVAGEEGFIRTFVIRIWADERFSALRTVEMGWLMLLVAGPAALSHGRRQLPLFFRLVAPVHRLPVYVINVAQTTNRQIVAEADSHQLRRLCFFSDKGDEIARSLDARRRFLLKPIEVTAVDPQGVQESLPSEAIQLRDDSGFIQIGVKYVAYAGASKRDYPKRCLVAMQDFLEDTSLPEILNDLGSTTLSRAVVEIIQDELKDDWSPDMPIITAAKLRDSYLRAQLLAQKVMLEFEQAQVAKRNTGIDESALTFDLEPSARHLERLDASVNRLNQLRDGIMDRKELLRAQLQGGFRQRLLNHLASRIPDIEKEDAEALERLVTHCGIKLAIDEIDVQPGAATECREMMTTIVGETREMIRQEQKRVTDELAASGKSNADGHRDLAAKLIEFPVPPAQLAEVLAFLGSERESEDGETPPKLGIDAKKERRLETPKHSAPPEF